MRGEGVGGCGRVWEAAPLSPGHRSQSVSDHSQSNKHQPRAGLGEPESALYNVRTPRTEESIVEDKFI